jgi:hypothetical protein
MVAALRFALAGWCLGAAAATAEGPCDITAKGGNPCVAAHSTTRALYGAYDGPLYELSRNSDGKTASVRALAASGFANIKTHDGFCPKMDSCVISRVFDQSPTGFYLREARGAARRPPWPRDSIVFPLASR